MIQNRTRNKQIVLRFTDKEYSTIKKAMDIAQKKSQSDFILDCVQNKPTIDMDTLRQILVELKRQGNNLNQIARSVNQGTKLSDNVNSLLDECYKTYSTLIDFAENPQIKEK